MSRAVLAVGALGDDLLGDMVAAAMARHGVDTSGLVRKSGAQTSATILGSDAGIEDFGQVLDFLSRTQPAVARRMNDRMNDQMKEHMR